MKCYIGCKVIQAVRSDRAEVEGYAVLYPDGYTTWAPLEAFDNAHREITDIEKRVIAKCLVEA